MCFYCCRLNYENVFEGDITQKGYDKKRAYLLAPYTGLPTHGGKSGTHRWCPNTRVLAFQMWPPTHILCNKIPH